MDSTQQEILDIFESSGALLRGHFILRSGLRSGHFFQCARVCEFMDKVTRLSEILIEKLGDVEFDTVLSPAMGGLVFGQEVARQSNSRYLFVEKKEDTLVMRRGFKFKPGEKVLIVEDVITRGGRVNETLKIAQANGANVVGIALLADRSAGNVSFNVPVTALAEFNFPTYNPESLPEELSSIPAIKPGS